ncbi:MAG: AhpC/TSA family protein [Prevotellaceae bacterium]|jgi:thiol-disulfide isomerase/thioredoxin|nr:AhpC/TSA family protein [Prevotellaceae bacterium]
MKIIKKTTLLSIACVIAAACSQKPATSYTIACNLQGIPDGTVVELVPAATYKEEKPVAEGVVTGGKVILTGVAGEPRLFSIQIAEKRVAKIMVENGKIILTGEATKSEQDGDITYTFDDIVIKGSKSHDLYLQKTAPRNGLDSMYRAYHENNKAISEAISAARANKNKALLDSLYTTAAYKKLAAEEKDFFDTVERITKGAIMDNKDSWWGPMLMLDFMSYFTEEQQPWYDAFSQEAKDSYYGQIVKEELFPEGFTGKPLPAFTLVGKDNKETTVASLSAGKKYILIDFWASWCGPCRREIPNLKNLYKKYAPKGFEIISISTDKKAADWEKALKEEKLAWPNYLDTKGEANDACRVKTIPAMFLIDDKGIVVAEKIRGEELAQELSGLFNTVSE